MAIKTKASVDKWISSGVGDDPVAGEEAEIVVPVDEVWEVEAAEVQLVADATVADRDIQIVFEDANGVEIGAGPVDATSITQSQTVTYHLAQYATVPADTATNHYDQVPKQPLVRIPPGGKIKTITANLQSGDDFGALTVLANKLIPSSD